MSLWTPGRTSAPVRRPDPSHTPSHGLSHRRPWRAWLLLAPGLVVIAALLLWPLVEVVLLSFQDKQLRDVIRGTTPWNGLANYQELFGNAQLWRVVLPNTVGLAVTCVVLTLVVGTAVALLLQRLGPVLRTAVIIAVLLAWAVPAVTATYTWTFIFDTNGGIVMRALSGLGLVDPATTNWFTERVPFLAIATVNVVHHSFPFVALTLYAGLQTIPRELHEAAMVDGASAWQRFRRLTLPLLRPVFAVVTILSVIWDVKVFTQLYLMPGGDGSNPEVLNLGVWSYLQSFGQNRFGFGSAIAVVLTLLLLVVTVVYLRVLTREDEL